MTTNTTRPGDRDPHADPADEWDRETTPAQTLATALRTAVAAQRDLAVLDRTLVYLAGPMSGIESFNFPAFQTAVRELTDLGLRSIQHTAQGTPPDIEEAEPWGNYLRAALRKMIGCDAVVVLPGWRESKGARLEVHVALELGMPVVEYPDLRPVESIGINIPAPPHINWDKTAPYPATQGGLAVIPEDAEYGTQTAEHIARRYGTAKPNSWAPIPENEPHWSDATMSTSAFVVPSDDETEAEYIKRRYGGNDPRRMFDDTIDMPKDEEPARKGRPMPDRPQA